MIPWEVVVHPHDPSGIELGHELQVAQHTLEVALVLGVVRVDVAVEGEAHDLLTFAPVGGKRKVACLALLAETWPHEILNNRYYYKLLLIIS